MQVFLSEKYTIVGETYYTNVGVVNKFNHNKT